MIAFNRFETSTIFLSRSVGDSSNISIRSSCSGARVFVPMNTCPAGLAGLGAERCAKVTPKTEDVSLHRSSSDSTSTRKMSVAASTEERCDYEAWFWSQTPNGNPHATGPGWNDYRGKTFVLPEHLRATRWTGPTAMNFSKHTRPVGAVLLESLLYPPAQALRPTRALDEAVRRCRHPAGI